MIENDINFGSGPHSICIIGGGYVYATRACVVLLLGVGGNQKKTHQPIVFRTKSIITLVVKLGLP